MIDRTVAVLALIVVIETLVLIAIALATIARRLGK